MIRYWRQMADLSRKGAAYRIGIPYSTWASWENGTRKPSGYLEKTIIKELIMLTDKRIRAAVKDNKLDNHHLAVGCIVDGYISGTDDDSLASVIERMRKNGSSMTVVWYHRPDKLGITTYRLPILRDNILFKLEIPEEKK